MTEKELRVILRGISSAKENIELLACENYPHASFVDQDFEDMFYELNRMAMLVHAKIDACVEGDHVST